MSEPNQNPTPGSHETTRLERPAPKAKRILLVEGDGFIRLVLLFLLKMAGFHVDFTSNGTIALRKLRSRHPDALLVELNLRGLSGLELIRTARGDLEFGSRPIYVYTPADLMNRATRKEVAKLATRVFDKRSVAMEHLVKTLAGLLATPESFATEHRVKAKDVGATPPPEIPIPREVEEIIAGVRTQSKLFTKSRDAAARIETCTELLSRVCALASCVEAAGLSNLTRQAKVLEAFLNQLCKDKKQHLESALKIINRAVEVMASLYRGPNGKKRDLAQLTAVIVDEAAPSNMAISDAFRHAGLHPIAFEAPSSALDHLKSNPADVIIANVLLPEAHGLSLSEIQKLSLHSATPVIFVPELVAPDQSITSKNKDDELPTSAPRLNTNPLLLKELTMKALNDAQSPHLPPPPPLVSNAPQPDAILEDDAPPAESLPVTTRVPPPRIQAQQALDDGFNLFAIPNQQGAAVRPQPPANRPLAAAVESFAAASPSSAADQPAAWLAGAKPASINGKVTVLFVEDDPFVLRVYTRSLNREGFQVEVAEDGLAALDVLPRVRPDIVVLDLMLPKLHGLEVLRFIRADVNLKGTPVLVLSNAYLEGLAAKANQAGANKGLLKTECTPTKLVEHIYELLGRPMPARSAAPGLREIEEAAMQEEAANETETAIFTRQAGLRADAPREVVQLRQVCLAYIKSNAAEERLTYLTELYRRVRFLSARAGLSGLTKIAELCSALEGLLFQIVFKHTEPTGSTFQTIAQAVDCLDRLAQNRDTTFVEPRAKAKILIVDDDPVCNFAMVNSLKHAGFEAVGVPEPIESLRVLKSTQFDVVLLDVNMPQLNGFQVCEHLRRLPEYASVPVIFVTIDAEFQTRARSIVAGGNDLMAKPVSTLELIVKVTMHHLNSSAKAGPATAQTPAPPLAWSPETMPTEDAAQSSFAEPSAGVENTSEHVNAIVDAASIPLEPFRRAEPAQTGVEGEAQTESALPETSTDNLQADDRPVELFPAAGLQPDAPEPAQLEPTIEEHLAEMEHLAAAEAGTAEPASVTPADFEPASMAAPSETVDPAQANPLEADNPAGPAEAATGETLERYKQERDALALRICNTEMDLSRAQARVERRDKTIEKLQQELEQLRALHPQPGQNAADQPVAVSPQLPVQPDALPAGLPPASAVTSGSALTESLAQARCAQLEHELAALLQSRADLEAKVAQEQQVASDSAKRTQDLEDRLAESAADLTRAQTELEQQKQQRQLVESDLRNQLEATGVASSESEAARKQVQLRCEELEQEFAALREARDELNSKFALEQQVTVDSARRTQELEQRLAESAAELERAREERAQQEQQQGRAETELRRQLEAATAASRQTEEAHKQALDRAAQLAQELEALRQARETLDGKVAQEQQVTAESARRAEELEQRLGRTAAELEQARAALDARKQEQARAESELRRQLEAANAASRQSEDAHKQAEAKAAQLEQELAALRQAREDLDTKFAHAKMASAESEKRAQELIQLLDQNASELKRTQADLESQTQFRTRQEVELRSQLDATTAALRDREAAQKQTQAHADQLGQELAAVRHAREALDARLAQEQQVSAQSAKRAQELEQQLGQTNAALKQAQARSEQLQHEIDLACHGREELNGKFVNEQRASAESGLRVKELENALHHRSADLERAKADFEQQLQQRSRVESELKAQLQAAADATKQAETKHQQAQSDAAALTQELGALRQAREELAGKFVNEQRAGAKSGMRLQELENALHQRSGELERAKADFEQQLQERSNVASELHGQLEAATALASQSDEAHKKAQKHCGELEKELAALRQARQQLNAKFVQQHQRSRKAAKRMEELEAALQHRGAELEGAKADLESQAKERAQTESELRRQLASASTALKQGQADQQQAAMRFAQLEQELAALRKAREELAGKFGQEQQLTAESDARLKELQGQLESRSSELTQAKAEAEQQARERAHAESELRQQLDAVGATLKQSQSAHQQTGARLGQFEQELLGLRQAREELAGKLGQEQQTSAQSATRIKELQGQLDSKSKEFDRARAELETHAKDRGRVEADLHKQLETAQQQAAARTGKLEQELAALRHAREELAAKFEKEQQRATESGTRVKELQSQLDSKSKEFDRASADLDAHSKERSRVESDLHKQLETTGAALKQSEAAQQQAGVRFGQLEQELAAVRKAREDLTARLDKEQQAGAKSHSRIKELEAQLLSNANLLGRAKTELEKQIKERGRLESDSRRQLDTANAAAKQNEVARDQALAQVGALQKELTALRQAREELTGKFGQEQQLNVESRARIGQLETQNAAVSAELAQAKAESAQRAEERRRVEADLRHQLEAAGATIRQTETAHQQAGARLSQLEQELAALRQAREALADQFGKEQQVTAASRARIGELETQIASRSAELAQAKAESQKQAEQHGQAESELRRQIETASAALQQSKAAHAEAQSQAAKVEHDLAALRQEGEALTDKFSKEQQASAEARSRIKDLEQQLQSAEAARAAQIAELDQRVRQGVTALARASAELSQEQGQRQRSEQRAASLSSRLQQLHEEFGRTMQAQRANLERITSLEEQLRQSEQNLVRRAAEFEQQQAARHLAEEQLQKAKELNHQFRKNLAFYEEANKAFDRTRQELEAKLDATLSAARETESRLVRETAERQRLAEALEGVRRDLQDQSRKREHLETDLQTALKALDDTGVRVQKEAGERQRLAELLETVQRELQDQTRKRESLDAELQTARGVMREIETRLQNEAAERQRLAEILQGVQRELQTELRQSEALQQDLRASQDTLRERETKLVSGAAERQRLTESLAGLQRDFQAQSRKLEALERELQTTLDVLHDSEAKLQQEVAARQRLNEALDAAELALRDRSQRSELEFSRLHSDLQLERAERKRQETHMARMRHISLNAVRASRVTRNSLRKQLHEALDNLYHSARSLLELENGGEQKRIAEAVMHDVLLVRARLREPEMEQNGVAGKSEAPAEPKG